MSTQRETPSPKGRRAAGRVERARTSERRPLLPRWRRSAKAEPKTDMTVPLLAGYRRPGPGKGRRIALYIALAALFIGWGFYFGLSAPFRIMPLVSPLPLLVLLIIWVLPAGEYAPTRAIEPLYLAFFAALVLWPNYIAVVLPHLPWLTLLRIFVTPLILIFLISISVSARFRATLGAAIGSAPVIWRLLAAFVGLQTFSLLLSDRPVLSFNDYLVDQLNHTFIFIVSCYVFLTPGFSERWAKAYLAMVYFVCGVGLWEWSIGMLPWAGHIPSFLRVETDLVANILDGAQRASLKVHRVQGMSVQPLAMAELLGLAAPFALHIAMNRYPLVLRILGAFYLPLALFLIELADSRLGNVALLSAVLFYILIWAGLKWRQNKQSLIAPALVLLYPALMAMTLVGTFFVRPLRVAVWGSGAQRGSTDARAMQWDLGIPKIITHPFGHGIGQAAKKLGYVNPAGKGTIDSHYLTILMDFGPLGYLLFYGLFAYAAWLAARIVIYFRPKGDTMILLPLMVAMLQFIIIKSVLSLDHNHPLVFMMLGGIVALSYRAKLEAQKAVPSA